ncbi:MAG: DUF6198 family protein [Clostridiales bacterium]|nr:DUF6198 family protein [Clostridiales bacterium]MCD8132766.1 DUF6198 family protein [Clostridiales bacterium]
MKNIRPVNIVKQLIIYVAGLFIITLGINISKMSALGISPVSSIPRACEQIWGFTLGTTTFIVYIFLVIAQLVVLRRRFHITNALGLLLTVLFSVMVDFTGTDPDAFGHILYGFPQPEGYIMKLIYMIVSVIIIGIGAFLYLRPNWVPMPAEGLAGAISEVSGIKFGNCKTLVDTGMVVIALIMQLIFLGGLQSFIGDGVVVREGTVIAAIFVGQIVKLLSKFFAKPMENWLHAGENRTSEPDKT